MRRFVAVLGVAMAMAMGAAPAQAADLSFTNPTPINGPASGALGKASPYPSPMVVSGGTGFFYRASVVLNGVTTTEPRDLDVMLESPSGQKTMLMSDAGGTDAVSDATINLTDSSQTDVPDGTFDTTSYRPTNRSTAACGGRAGDDLFESPAPAAATTANFDAFTRSQVNGTWKLWVMDDCAADDVAISEGWTLNVSTAPDFGVGIPGSGTSGKAAVYPVDVPISGQGTRVTKVVANLIAVNHTEGQDMDLLLVGPTGASTLLMSDALSGRLENLDSGMRFDDSGPNIPATTGGISSWSGPFRPTDYVGSTADAFPAPAPAGPYGTALSSFVGTNPNGVWKLYAVDDAAGDVGGLGLVALAITATTPTGQTVTTTQTVKPTARDATAPVVVVTPGKRRALADVLRTGSFGISVKTNEPAKIAGQALLSAALTKKLKLPSNGKAFTSAKKKAAKPAIVAKGTASAGKAGTVRLKLKLTRKARRALARRRKSVSLQLRTRVTDGSGNRRLLKSTLKLKR